jgi:DNA-binding NarL/FixJ family response regulator
MPEPRVLVVDARAAFAAALSSYLDRMPTVLSSSTLPSCALRDPTRYQDWDVVVADEASSRSLVRQLVEPRLVVLVEHDDVVRIADLVAAGASGVCGPDEGLDAVAEAVVTVAAGGMRLPVDLVGPVLEQLMHRHARAATAQRSLQQLTARERQILELLAQGLRRAEIAERLTLSPHTVRTHVQHLLRKLSLHSQLEASALGRELLRHANSQDTAAVDLRAWVMEHSRGRRS